MKTLKGEARFSRLFKKGRRTNHKGVTVVSIADDAGGIAVCTRGLKLASKRNRRKRILRAALIPIMNRIKKDYAVAIFGPDSFENITLQERTKAILEALQKARVI